MQAVMNSSAGFGPMTRLQFARGRSYMMRSEKRSSMGPSQNTPDPGKRPRRRRRRRAGFFYKLFMMLLLLTIWPLGLIMLWRRKVRWGVFTKLLTSIVTLAACVILIGFALTINTGNAQYTAIQDEVNGFLDTAADHLVDFGGIVEEKAEIVYSGMTDMADALWYSGRAYIADGIDQGIIITQQLKLKVEDLIAGITGETQPQEDPDAQDGPTSTLAAIETAKPNEAAEPAELTVNIDASSLPVYIPGVTPDPAAAFPVEEGTLTHQGDLGEAAATAEPTPSPTIEPLNFTVKSAADATVYYNEGGKCYHMTSACGSMTNAAEHTLGETIGVENHRCVDCGTPEKTILDEKHIVWVDDSGIAHLSDECEEFTGSWELIPAAQANEDELTACSECCADLYLRAVAAELDFNIIDPATEGVAQEAAGEDAAAEISLPGITAEPSEEADSAVQAVLLKSSGEATVYRALNDSRYHTFNRCAGLTGAGMYTLAECAQDGRACSACGAPKAELADMECLWMDGNGLCHTTDECSAFEGKYALIPAEDVSSAEISVCSECSADEYLAAR